MSVVRKARFVTLGYNQALSWHHSHMNFMRSLIPTWTLSRFTQINKHIDVNNWQVLHQLNSSKSDANTTSAEVEEVRAEAPASRPSDVIRYINEHAFASDVDDDAGATQKVAVVIVEEERDDDVTALNEVAAEARSRGIEIVAVTIGKKTASRPLRHAVDHVLHVHRASALRKVVDDVVASINQSCARRL